MAETTLVTLAALERLVKDMLEVQEHQAHPITPVLEAVELEQWVEVLVVQLPELEALESFLQFLAHPFITLVAVAVLLKVVEQAVLEVQVEVVPDLPQLELMLVEAEQLIPEAAEVLVDIQAPQVLLAMAVQA